MKWDDLKIVLAVSRSGTMSGAAKLLNVQHSTVSRRIKALEKKLGTNLVRRNKGSYELTRAGTECQGCRNQGGKGNHKSRWDSAEGRRPTERRAASDNH